MVGHGDVGVNRPNTIQRCRDKGKNTTRDGRESRLTCFTRGASVAGLALASSVDAFPVHSARDGASDEGQIEFGGRQIAFGTGPAGFAVTAAPSVSATAAAQHRAYTC